MKRQRDIDMYTEMYPRARRWLNQCVACQRTGYKPDLPEQIGQGVMASHLREYYQPLALDESGLCDMCAAAISRRNVEPAEADGPPLDG